MKRFADLKVGDEFFSTFSISKKELNEYLAFSRIKNPFLASSTENDGKKIVSGRAILSRMEGEFTRLSQVYGNSLVFSGADGDKDWSCRNTRFLKPLYTDNVLKIKFTISAKEEINQDYGKIYVDFEGLSKEDDTIVISKKNIYRMKKDP